MANANNPLVKAFDREAGGGLGGVAGITTGGAGTSISGKQGFGLQMFP